MCARIVAMKEMIHASCRGERQRVNGHVRQQQPALTAAIEIVARANGSPMMFPKLMRLRPYWGLEYSIFPSDGERSEP